MRDAKKVGLSRRELEWAAQGMLRQVPSDPASLAKHIVDVMLALIEKNNAAIARSIAREDGPQDDGEGGRF